MAQIPERNNWYFGQDFNATQKKSDILMSNIEKLINMLLELFKYTGLPDSIPFYELEKLLLLTGSASLIKVNGIWYANKSGLGCELDAYYHPKKDIIVNPWIDGGISDTRDVDSDNCVLVFNNRLRTSAREIIIKYATLLTEVEITMRNSSKLARVSNFIVANDDRTKASADRALDQIDEGEDISIIGGSMLPDNIVSIPFETRYDIEGLTRVRQYAEKSFLKEFGISTNNESKSQYVSDENLTWEFEPSRALITNMFNQRKDDLEKFNSISGFNVQIELGEVLAETKRHYEEVMSQYQQENESAKEVNEDGGNTNEQNETDNES